MQIEIRLDDSCNEAKVIIISKQMNEEVNDIIRRLSDKGYPVLSGFRNELLEIINQDDIIRIYAANGKVFAVTQQYEYLLRLRLYEVEKRLNSEQFIRISNSEIINLKKVRNFDLSLSGTICVSLSDNTLSYTSRRYVAKIKQILGI